MFLWNRIRALTAGQPLYGICILSLSIVVHIAVSRVGWDNSILDFHGFRQSHTALTSYCLAKDGFKIAYETPILGVPWSIPFEFPIFEAVVAFVHNTFGSPLDQTGRGVSLFFFYASLVPLFVIAKKISGCGLCAYLSVSFTLLCPIYLFWSRTFLIESTALFFTLIYLMSVVLALRSFRTAWLGGACLAGGAAGAIKCSTFAIGLVAAGLLFVMEWAGSRKSFQAWRSLHSPAVLFTFCIALPLLVTMGWTVYADHVKALNPIGMLLTTGEMHSWNFGTINQKLSWETWRRLYNIFFPYLFGLTSSNPVKHILFISIFFVGMVVLPRTQRRNVIWLLIVFLWGPVVFTNLFYVHQYYWYENAVYFMVALGFILGELSERNGWALPTKLVLIPALSLILIYGYVTKLYPIQSKDHWEETRKVARVVSDLTTDDGVVYIRGLDWNPSLAYYARRRALMIPAWESITEERITRALTLTGVNTIQAMVVNMNSKGMNEALAAEEGKRLGIKGRPVYEEFGHRVYAR